MSFFEAAARLYEVFRPAAKVPGDVDEVGFMRFEEAEQRRKQVRLGGPTTQLVSPDSGQINEALRPTVVAERCGKRAKRESDGVIWVSVHRR